MSFAGLTFMSLDRRTQRHPRMGGGKHPCSRREKVAVPPDIVLTYRNIPAHAGKSLCRRRTLDRVDKAVYSRAEIAELTLGPLSIPTQRFALDGEFRGSC